MTYPAAIEALAALPRPTLLAIANVSRDDGHSLFDPTAYIAAGLTMELANFFTRLHQSDGTPKGTLFNKGGIVPELTGIYGLTVLEAITDALNLERPHFHGRGFRARALFTLIQHHCATPTLAAA